MFGDRDEVQARVLASAIAFGLNGLHKVDLGKGKDWGQYQDGLIKLSRGEWQPFDFFHELTHFHEAFARKTNDRKLIKLYDLGKRIILKRIV